MVVFFSLRREARIVRQFLYPEYRSGFFSPQEYDKLCTVRGRMGMSWRMLRTRGYSMWRERMRCNQLASELAFHRSRVARGIGPKAQAAQERESNYLYGIQELRHKLGAKS
jgi:hypothetical protein